MDDDFYHGSHPDIVGGMDIFIYRRSKIERILMGGFLQDAYWHRYDELMALENLPVPGCDCHFVFFPIDLFNDLIHYYTTAFFLTIFLQEI